MALRDLFIRLGIKIEGAEGLNAVAGKANAAVGALRGVSRAADAAGRATRSVGVGGGFLGQLASVATIYGIMRLGRGISDFVRQQIDAAVRLDVMAEKLGVSARELKMYQFIADKSKISFVELTTAFRFFNRAAGEVGLGTKGTTKIFNQMGLSVRDAHGRMKPTEELLFEFSDRLAVIPDQATRTAYAMRALGRGGSALLPILQHGSAELRKQFALYKEFTGGPSERMIRASKEFNDQLALQKLGWKALASSVMETVLPTMLKWQDRALQNTRVMVDYVKHTTGVQTALMFLGGAGVIGALVVLTRAIKTAFALANFGPAAVLLLAIAAAVGYIYLAFDDFYALLHGKRSIIGDFIDSISGVGASAAWVKNLKVAFEAVTTAIFGAKGQNKSFAQEVIGFFASTIPAAVQYTLYALVGICRGLVSVRALIQDVVRWYQRLSIAIDRVVPTAIGGSTSENLDARSAALDADKERTDSETDKWGKMLDRLARAVDFTTPTMYSNGGIPFGSPGTGEWDNPGAQDQREAMGGGVVGPGYGPYVTGGAPAAPQTTNHVQQQITVQVTAPSQQELAEQIRRGVLSAMQEANQSTFNQANPSMPDPLSLPLGQ